MDLAFITGDPRSPARDVSHADAWKHYAVGPPLVMHAADLAAIVAPWARFVPRVRAVFPKLLARVLSMTPVWIIWSIDVSVRCTVYAAAFVRTAFKLAHSRVTGLSHAAYA